MPKNIVFCADGSWSHPAEVQDGTWNYPGKDPISTVGTTNVFKLYDALTPSPDQVTFYDDGVGTDGSFVRRMVGGAFGEGLFDKIKDGYSNIAHRYEDGDAIHLFGFSRGAYTVRCLAGMIAECGIPEPGKFSEAALEDTFAAYRERDPSRKQERIAALTEKYGNLRPGRPRPRIAEIGVWDTVGSLGIPGYLFEPINEKKYGFLTTKLDPNVEAAWQALAIDERRAAFAPTLFTPPFAPGQQVDQVWFAGVHGDVGGGTKEPGLSDITLGWMMKKAASKGLAFDPITYRKYTGLPKERALVPMDQSLKPRFA